MHKISLIPDPPLPLYFSLFLQSVPPLIFRCTRSPVFSDRLTGQRLENSAFKFANLPPGGFLSFPFPTFFPHSPFYGWYNSGPI